LPTSSDGRLGRTVEACWWCLQRQGRKKVVDDAVTAHVANETRLLKPLTAAEYRSLDQALRTLLGSFENPKTE
jgi:hypothetical protein